MIEVKFLTWVDGELITLWRGPMYQVPNNSEYVQLKGINYVVTNHLWYLGSNAVDVNVDERP